MSKVVGFGQVRDRVFKIWAVFGKLRDSLSEYFLPNSQAFEELRVARCIAMSGGSKSKLWVHDIIQTAEAAS